MKLFNQYGNFYVHAITLRSKIIATISIPYLIHLIDSIFKFASPLMPRLIGGSKHGGVYYIRSLAASSFLILFWIYSSVPSRKSPQVSNYADGSLTNSKFKWNGPMIQNMEKEDPCRKTANTEYVPTKSRITKPPPPKPATNPLQFVRIAPCPLSERAQEQIKKASDVKVIRKEVREEAEDWQHNLDSWRSNRRKLQEHIIERVDEVKKLEQEGQERTRKTSAFSEKRGRRFNIPVYDDDSNDLSDYGIGLSSSKSDKSSDNASQSSKDDINECQNLQYGYRSNAETKPNDNDIKTDQLNNHINNLKGENTNSNDYTSNENNIGQYTYEGAIQNYRMRIKSNVIFNNRQPPEPPRNKEYINLLPKGNIICKRKELFESERNSENQESSAQKKFSEDFANSQSIKERLQSLEKCTESSMKNDNRNSLPVGTVTSKLQKFNSVSDNFNNKDNKNNFNDSTIKSASSYSLDGMSSGGEENKNKWGEKYEYNQYFSPEDSMFMDKMNMFTRDLDTLYPKSSDNCNDEILNSYPPSTSSTELMLMSSDKEDSGIHTADVSCSVSQSDEVLEDPDIPSNTIPKCIEKLNIEKITKEKGLQGNLQLGDNMQLEEHVQQKRNNLLGDNIHQSRNILEDNTHKGRNIILEERNVLNENIHHHKNIQEDNINHSRNDLNENIHHDKNLMEENIHQSRNMREENIHQSRNMREENIHHGKNLIEDSIHQSRNIRGENIHNGGKILEENIYQNKNNLNENIHKSRNVLEENIHQDRNVLGENIHNGEVNIHQDKNILNGINENVQQNKSVFEENINQNRNVVLEEAVCPDRNAYLKETIHLSPEEIIRLKENKMNADLKDLIQPINNIEDIPLDATQNLIQFDQTEVVEKDETPFELITNKQDVIPKNDKPIPIVETLQNSFTHLNLINNDVTLHETPIDLPPFEIDCLEDDNLLLSPVLPKMQPPAVKPPPPPVSDSEQIVDSVDSDKKFNTTKRLKKEILIKRSTFLGLDEPTDDQMFPNVPIDRPPDVNNFLQKLNGARDGSSKEELRNKPVFEKSADVSSKSKKNQPNIEEDEITKKEREIIEMVEKEEQFKDHDPIPSKEDFPNTLTNYSEQYPYNSNNPYYLDSHYDNLDDRDSEVLKVEHELLQLEREEQERQKENMLFREKSMKMKQNYHSYENLCDVNVFPENANYYKSMPELQQFPRDYNNKPSVLNHKPMYENTSFYRKSMPDIEHVYNNTLETDYNQQMLMGYSKMQQPIMTANHRKTSMPELQKVPQVVSNLPIIPAKPLKRPTKEEKEKFKCLQYEKQMKPIARHSLQPSSASRPKHHDNWRQPKINAEPKNYNQHWLIQEAEFRRISEMQNSMPNRMHSNSHLSNFGNGNMPIKPVRPEPPIPKDNGQLPHLGHPPQSGYSLMPYSSSTGIDESQNVILSVSGKKKCSYCGNELGRGAAMIIETLNLFYHMECFKCCVCHVELGDGLMGTDVRVRNQKLHCHNCYSSDDGVKFSCV